MTRPPPLRPICLIGPPAAGKTTLAEALGRDLDAPILRPRDLVTRTINSHPGTLPLFPRDDRGHVPDESLGLALRICLDQLSGTVLFESLPWDAIQLADLHRIAGDQVVVLHLNASDNLVTDRRTGRRHCPKCYPLSTSVTDQGDCVHCGSSLTPRNDDEETAFAERLQAHRANAAKILALARNLRVRVFTLDAVHSPGALTSQALAALETASSDVAA